MAGSGRTVGNQTPACEFAPLMVICGDYKISVRNTLGGVARVGTHFHNPGRNTTNRGSRATHLSLEQVIIRSGDSTMKLKTNLKVGKPSVSDFHFVKLTDKASVKML